MYPVTFSFFLRGTAALRTLHSFPTRRSSDLVDVVVQPEPLGTGDALRVARGALGDTRQVLVVSGDQDRKSTRLNSSHRCISYAGFCLKKKKHGGHGTDRPELCTDGKRGTVHA